MASSESPKKTVVVGVGNELLKDEGVGVHAVRALQRAIVPSSADWEIIEGGTSPDVLFFAREADKFILIDALQGGSEPGAIYRLSLDELPPELSQAISLHQVNLLEGLRLMQCLVGKPKEILLLGIEPKEIDWGLELSPELEGIIPQVTKLVLEELRVTPEDKF